MSQVPDRSTGFHFPVGAQTCSRWMRLIMDRIKVDPKYKGGSIRMAAASAAIDGGVPIDVAYSTLADGPAGKSSTSSTTELASEMWPRALA